MRSPLHPRHCGQKEGDAIRFEGLAEHFECGGVGDWIAAGPAGNVLRCVRCSHVLCEASENYKRYALRRERSMEALSGRPLPSGEPYLGVLYEYACPGCATLLHPERQGQVCPGDYKLDVGPALADGAFLLLGVLPGMFALGVDAATGALWTCGEDLRPCKPEPPAPPPSRRDEIVRREP